MRRGATYAWAVMPGAEASPLLRADARRNRDAILDAARRVFADEGLHAPLDRIAKLAGVGRATLYRHFATRDDLVHAIFRDNWDALAAVAAQAGTADDAFFVIVDAAIAQQANNLGFIELFTRPPSASTSTPGLQVAREAREPWIALIRGPLQRAQAAGLVRGDVVAEDVGPILLMTGAVAAALRGRVDASERRRRVVAVLFDGLTLGVATPLDGPPPAAASCATPLDGPPPAAAS
jgi:AcrR family transcriptional regulator